MFCLGSLAGVIELHVHLHLDVFQSLAAHFIFASNLSKVLGGIHVHDESSSYPLCIKQDTDSFSIDFNAFSFSLGDFY